MKPRKRACGVAHWKKQHPKCFGCGKKAAKELKLPGMYGSVEMFCTLRCAAKRSIEPFLCGAVWSCTRCAAWHTEDTDICDCGNKRFPDEN